MSNLAPGERIAHRYIVQSRLGSGGMATVYHCVDATTGEPVAVKLLHHHLLVDNPEIVERFQQEARMMIALSQPVAHPNVVAVKQVLAERNLAAFVMELVQGAGGLDEYLAAAGPLAEAEAVDIMGGLLAGLNFVHEHKIIHRDLKPSNILLARGRDGRLIPKISDFGIAKSLDDRFVDHALSGALTQTDSMFGSPAYMAPELFDSATSASFQSDIYAVGVLLYEALIGSVPFVVDSVPSHVMRVATELAQRPSATRKEISGDTDRAIARALAKNPGDRFQSAEHFMLALDGRSIDPTDPLSYALPDPQRISREYRVIRRIGRGPVTNVYQCIDEGLDVPVAIKLMRGDDNSRMERFIAEARAQSTLHQGRPHRGIVAIRHVISADGKPAIVEEFVDGSPIDHYVVDEQPKLPTILKLFADAADALAHAHAADVLHNNLKPSNMLVVGAAKGSDEEPRSKLSDFRMDGAAGLSAAILAERTNTEAYLAPERFESDQAASPASDVYALGALLVHALAGRLPAGAYGRGAGDSVRAAIPSDTPQVESLARRALAQRPEERPTAAELRDGLKRALVDLTDPAIEAVALPAEPQRGSSALTWILAAVVVALLAGGGVFFGLQKKEEPTEAPTVKTEPAARADVVEPRDVEVDTGPAYVNVKPDVERLFAQKTNVVSDCLLERFKKSENASKLKSANGALKIEVRVDATGAIEGIDVVKDDLAIIELGECVQERVATWTFPSSGRPQVWEKEWFF